MNKQHLIKLRKQVTIVGAIAGSLTIGLPVMAMPRMMNNQHLAQAGSGNPATNPHPSIFNEPPYNRAGSSSDTMPGSPSMNQSMPGGSVNQSTPGGGMSPSDSSGQSSPPTSSPTNPNLPASVPSPYQQQQGGGVQPEKPTGSGASSAPDTTSPTNPNLPATAPSPYLQQQQTGSGDSTQPNTPTGSKKRRHSSRPSSTSPTNPNLPATAPSPYLQQQQTGSGDSTQPNTPTK